jgi:PAS domain S-box-containing protein
MRKKIYTLNDIEKLLSYVPPFFILALMALSVVITHIVITHRQESDIALLTQKQAHQNQNLLDGYIASIHQRIDTDLSQVQERLKRSVHILEGIETGLPKGHTIEALKPYIQTLEKNNHVQFVIFDSNWTIAYGLPQLAKIENLIFNKKNDSTLLKITMMYIFSQGKNSSLSWKNDIDKTIQLSYFEQKDEGGVFIGAFSMVDDLRSITLHAFSDAMIEENYTPYGYYFWLYDHSKRKAFNHQHQKKWKILPAINQERYRKSIGRYYLSVGISRTGNLAEKEISKIWRASRNRQTRIITIIMIIGLALMAFSWLFSTMIKRIFGTYNIRVKHTNMRLKRLKERYELAVIASNDGLWDTNFKTKKTFFSQKWLDILGYHPGEINSFETWLTLIHPEDKEHVIGTLHLHKRTRQEKHIICEYRLRTRTGAYIWMLGRGKVFFDEEGDPLRLLMMSMDISEQKEASNQLAILVEKEVAKNQEKQKLLIQQNKLAAMGEMIGAIAHQWRQPLNNITLILHFIRDNIDKDTFTRTMLDQYVDRAKKQIDFMSDTIDDFRDFYKPTKSKAPFDVTEAIHSTLSIMHTQFDKSGIKVTLTGNSFTINGYENEFRQAILNILANAIDAIVLRQKNQEGLHGEIRIDLSTDTITIYNNGGHVRYRVLERMFEPYFTTKFEDKGTGIGLYMTRTIIENNMQGEILAENRDEGVMFTIRFHPHQERVND